MIFSTSVLKSLSLLFLLACIEGSGGLRSGMLETGSFDTGLHADAVEFCPVRGLEDMLVCGTYQLQESEEGGRAEHQTRLGRLYVMHARDVHDGRGLLLSEDSRMDVPGVFDIKWSGARDRAALLGHAAADGFLYLYCLAEGGGPSGQRLVRAGAADCRRPDSSRQYPQTPFHSMRKHKHGRSTLL